MLHAPSLLDYRLSMEAAASYTSHLASLSSSASQTFPSRSSLSVSTPKYAAPCSRDTQGNRSFTAMACADSSDSKLMWSNDGPTASAEPVAHRASPAIDVLTPGKRVKVDLILDAIKWDEKGLIVAIAQHVNTGAILMQGFANRDAVSVTIASGKATFYSRSRSSLWTKGETSSNFINVVDLFFDCDRDSIIYLGEPQGPTCHTGAETCYFTPAWEIGNGTQPTSKRYATTTLYSLEETIGKRKLATLPSSKPSWTRKLLNDQNLLCSKICEEADELCRTLLNNEGKNRTASEMADVLYHAMVLLAVQDVKLEDVLKILQARFAQSGIEEKSRRM